MQNTEKFLIQTFGRRKGKALTRHQQNLVDNLLPLITTMPGGATLSQGRLSNAILEIGFGSGEHLLHLARNNPETLIIGAEPYVNGVASLLSAMTKDKWTEGQMDIIKPEYKNIRIWPDDVRKLLSACPLPSAFCPDFGFAKIYILHPDPWPKARHEKRRLMNAEFLIELSEYLTPGGQIIFGTDHTDLFEWTLIQARNTKYKIRNKNFTQAPESGLDTRYREKNKFGSPCPAYLVLEK
ncbi:MAG: tRNA (guanine(46)-N(7))-methyltransferase TrmB [Rickettsiales bacterium]|jgi:tRNA (guanine-N7-)-methyltransferase|nr:tRNA (guanine(46)-N(7))-methyltransferase TrmB [Rickettsiales bacterium]